MIYRTSSNHSIYRSIIPYPSVSALLTETEKSREREWERERKVSQHRTTIFPAQRRSSVQLHSAHYTPHYHSFIEVIKQNTATMSISASVRKVIILLPWINDNYMKRGCWTPLPQPRHALWKTYLIHLPSPKQHYPISLFLLLNNSSPFRIWTSRERVKMMRWTSKRTLSFPSRTFRLTASTRPTLPNFKTQVWYDPQPIFVDGSILLTWFPLFYLISLCISFLLSYRAFLFNLNHLITFPSFYISFISSY